MELLMEDISVFAVRVARVLLFVSPFPFFHLAWCNKYCVDFKTNNKNVVLLKIHSAFVISPL